MQSYIDARERKGYTLKDVASITGIAFKTLERWESGRTSPNALNLITLCKLYECTADELLGIAPIV